MAYYDHKSGSSERAVAITLVTALQVGVFAALVHGLAVAFIPQADAPATIGEQIALPPPPVPDPVVTPQDTPATPYQGDERILTPPAGTTTTTTLLPPSEMPGGTGDIILGDPPGPPLPPPNLAQGARPANNPGSWVTQNDYSASDIRAERQGTARFTLGIGTDGKVTSCSITASTGFESLDAATCRYVSRRARFQPALDDAGVLAAGSYTGSIRWVIPK